MGDFWAVPFARMGMQGCGGRGDQRVALKVAVGCPEWAWEAAGRERHEFEHPVTRGQLAALRRMPQATRAEGQGQTVGILDTLDRRRRRYL